MPDELAIKVENVSKNFILPHEKAGSFKNLFTGITKGRKRGFEVQHALRDISFEIKRGEFFGIVGRNGSGKSTLLKILAGIYQPSNGKVKTQGKLVPFIELGVGFNPELTGRENVYLNGALLGFSKKEISSMYKDIVEFAELDRFMDQKLKNYSSGMQVRLAFSMATRSEADILLVDEVLAVGDADFQRKCFSYFRKLKKNKKTVVFVSHDMSAITEYCDRAVLIEKNEIVAQGTASLVAAEYNHLFMDRNHKVGPGDNNNRWGSGVVRYGEVKCSPNPITNQKEIILSTQIFANEDQESLIAGFAIKDLTDTLLLGTNTHLEGKKILNIKAGESLEITWHIPNILKDGDYFINLALESSEGDQCDSWEEAVQIRSLRSTKTGFPIQPSFKVNIKNGNKN